MDKLQAMDLFLRIIQEGNLSAAGRKFGLSTASVSRLMSSLENDLGTRLLNRSSRKLTLTDAGALYYAKVEKILKDVQEADDSTKQLSKSARGALRIHSSVQVGCHLIAPILPKFTASFPDIEIELRVSDAAVNLMQDNFDIDIRLGRMPDSALIAKRLITTELLLCASPAYINVHGMPATPRDLKSHKCLFYRAGNEKPIWRFMRNHRLEEVRVRTNVKSNNGEILRIAAIEGTGIALLRDWALIDDLKAGRLIRVLPGYKTSYKNYDNGMYAVYQAGRHVPEKLKIFLEFIATHLKSREQ